MLLKLENVSKKFNNELIFSNISFSVKEGEIFSIVGKSGIGKSTLAKIIIGLIKPTSGRILFNNSDISNRKISDIQMIFQDPYSALNEKMTVEEIIKEPLIVNKQDNINERVTEMLNFLKLIDFKTKYPNELSGGQRQRVIVGAAMILKPKLVICDEPIASLDLTIQEQIIQLIKFFNKKYRTTFIFISHDLQIVKHISDTIFKMEVKNEKN
ncbi:dipeptide/oligopeptide/nickel ABC transporter ATP-binding protein [Sneathia sanguinegens]|uniref:dipeptide/oligopeptide/nickel ABC transporter ATP-binding protein n=1 Tax=Sneathia sanguinegens TaxID=40543 RepID=UPI00290C1010|nr:dipeptide/oligopeptide/nickel ABC transporter ATP-binding protein [Sneathia sanguinegens]MDU7496561.1 dipeptide/oligopeptide/nickel ABC transporter ATP-binding protein [Sneathia sanguinegens]